MNGFFNTAFDAAANGHFGYHYWRRDQEHRQQIDDDKSASAVASDRVAKSPDVADAHRSANRRHEEHAAPRPFCMRCAHAEALVTSDLAEQLVGRQDGSKLAVNRC